MLNYDTYPNPNGVDTIRGYVQHGWKPGGFMEAVLSNDLIGACANADCINKNLIFEIAVWCSNELPNDCWGTRESFKVWLAHKGLDGLKENA